MKTIHPSKNRGSTLVIVMAITVAFTLMVAALLQLGSFNEFETIKQLRNTQAHWLAEAGLERALSWVAASEDYRDTLPGSEPGYSVPFDELPNGEYALKVWAPVSGEEVVIQSMGTTTNGGISSSVTNQLEMSYYAGTPNLGNVEDGDMIIKNSDFVGNLNVKPPGTLHFEGGDNSVDGIVDVDSGITGSIPNDLVEGDLPESTIEKIDREPYELLLETASSTNPVDAIQGPYDDELDLDGAPDNTIYVNGNITITEDVEGPGVIVANGTIDFGANGITLGDKIKIVADNDISVNKNNTTFGENTELFTMSDFYLSNNQDYPNPYINIIAIGDVNIEANMDGFTGIIYAEGAITFNNGVQDFSGALIAWDGINIGANFTGEYDPSVFTNAPLPFDFGNNIIPTSSTWQKL